MKEKTRKIFIMIVMAALIVSLTAASFAALTYGRYTGGKLDEDSPYEEIIDFVGATAFEVTSPDAFINAINNGYSYIKIADDAEEPFVINNNVADVYTNLVLDVNGHVVVRNSRNPLLDVRRSISVVLVYDSSTDADGGFYNPVGSSLQTSGGTLTVGEGIYESGPSDAADATLPSSNAVSLVTRENRTSTSYNAAQSGVSLPILTKSGGDKTKSGDKYLPENWTDTVSGDQINPDTYLLYTEVQNAFVGSGQTADGTIPDASAPADPDNPVVFQSGQLYINCDSSTIENNGTTTTTYSADIFSPVSNVASCDFYYYYPIDNGAYSSTAGSPAAPKTYAVVYGYNDVKGLAEDEDDNNDGIGEATALIDDGLVWPYAAIRSVEDGEVGGVTHARGGTFTTNFGTDNTYGIYSVGGTMTVGTDSASTPPKFTATGEGTCIGMSAGENDTLTIASGNFSSQVGDTILMRGGEMTVTGGTFTKTGSHPVPTGNPTATDYAASRTALIHMLGGDLTVNGTVGTDTSVNPTYSVNMTAGSTDAPLTNVFGIYSTETTDETTGKAVEGTVTVSGCKITVNGTYSAGVLSSAGTVNVGGTENGKADTDITVANSILNDRLTSSAVSSEGGEVNLNSTVNISSDSLGITARGEVNVNGGTTSVNTPNATGVYVNNGTLTVKNNATLTVDSAISNASYSWVTPPGTDGDSITQIYNGVFVHGGSLNSTGTLNVTFTGVESDPSTLSPSDNTAFRTFQVKSYAVRVDDSDNVTIAAGTITNSIGGGVLVDGGTVKLGTSVTSNDGTVTRSGPTVSAKGDEYQHTTTGWLWDEVISPVNYNCYNKGGNWSYTPPTTGGDAVKIVDGTLKVDGGEYTAAYGNGILVSNGTATVNGGTFKGQDPRRINGGFYTGAGGNYGLKVLGGYAIVNGGTFIDWVLDDDGNRVSGGGGGVFIMGENANTPQTQIISATINVNGATAVSVWEYANVKFGVTNTDNTDEINSQLIVRGASTGLAVETTSTEGRQTIVINSGKFTGQGSGNDQNGIWYGNQATMKINGGEFIGGTSGLFFRVNQWTNDTSSGTNNVQIYGGTFIGTPGKRAEDWGRAYWQNGAIGASSSGCDNGDGVGADMRIQDFIVCDSDENPNKSIYYFDSIDENAEPVDEKELSEYVDTSEDSRDAQRINQTTCQYVRIEIR